jgi:hypothetical protein
MVGYLQVTSVMLTMKVMFLSSIERRTSLGTELFICFGSVQVTDLHL